MDTLGLVIVTEHGTEPGGGASLWPQPRRYTCMFLQGRERRESAESPHVSITQPDLRRTLDLDLQKRTFTVRPLLAQATPEEIKRWARRAGRARRPAQSGDAGFEIFVHVERTEELKTFFGFQTRRYVTTRKGVYPPDADESSEAVTDGWYLDDDHPALPKNPRGFVSGVMVAGNRRPVIHRSGETVLRDRPANGAYHPPDPPGARRRRGVRRSADDGGGADGGVCARPRVVRGA
jgi:hypothetical protein